MNDNKIESVIEIIARHYDVTVPDILSNSRKSRIVKPRWVIMRVLYDHVGLSSPKIGALLNRDHTTILNGLEHVGEIPDNIFPILKNIWVEKKEKPTKYKGKYRWIYHSVGAKCMVCSFDDIVEVHHIVPLKEGGTSALNNILVLCPNHHAMLHAGLLRIKDIDYKKFLK